MIAVGIIIVIAVAFIVTVSALFYLHYREETRRSKEPERWLVTGEVWGSHVYAHSKQEARKLFLDRYPMETIISVKKNLQPKDVFQ